MIQVRPLGYFVNVPINTPIASTWKNYCIYSSLEVQADNILNHFWIQVAVSHLKLKRPSRSDSPTDTSVRSGVPVMYVSRAYYWLKAGVFSPEEGGDSHFRSHKPQVPALRIKKYWFLAELQPSRAYSLYCSIIYRAF